MTTTAMAMTMPRKHLPGKKTLAILLLLGCVATAPVALARRWHTAPSPVAPAMSAIADDNTLDNDGDTSYGDTTKTAGGASSPSGGKPAASAGGKSSGGGNDQKSNATVLPRLGLQAKLPVQPHLPVKRP